MFAVVAFTMVACSNDEEEKKKEEPPVELKTDKDKWSYYMGYQAGNPLMSAQNPNKSQFAQYKKQFIDGFKNGYRELSMEEQQACMQSIQQMMGGSRDGSTFDASQADKGCNCIGMLTANDTYMRLEPVGPTSFINLDKFEAGFVDGVNEKAKRVSDDEFQGLQSSINAEAERLQAAKAEEDAVKFKDVKEAGEAFLAENAKNAGVKVTESGLQYEVLKAGSGAKPTATSRVTVHYHGTLIDGSVFDSSVDRGQPATFGLNQVISGWTEGVQLMSKGAKYRFYVPQELAYGANSSGIIKPFSTLIFEVELLEIQ